MCKTKIVFDQPEYRDTNRHFEHDPTQFLPNYAHSTKVTDFIRSVIQSQLRAVCVSGDCDAQFLFWPKHVSIRRWWMLCSCVHVVVVVHSNSRVEGVFVCGVTHSSWKCLRKQRDNVVWVRRLTGKLFFPFFSRMLVMLSRLRSYHGCYNTTYGGTLTRQKGHFYTQNNITHITLHHITTETTCDFEWNWCYWYVASADLHLYAAAAALSSMSLYMMNDIICCSLDRETKSENMFIRAEREREKGHQNNFCPKAYISIFFQRRTSPVYPLLNSLICLAAFDFHQWNDVVHAVATFSRKNSFSPFVLNQ